MPQVLFNEGKPYNQSEVIDQMNSPFFPCALLVLLFCCRVHYFNLKPLLPYHTNFLGLIKTNLVPNFKS